MARAGNQTCMYPLFYNKSQTTLDLKSITCCQVFFVLAAGGRRKKKALFLLSLFAQKQCLIAGFLAHKIKLEGVYRYVHNIIESTVFPIANVVVGLGLFSMGCGKSRTKEITLANHKGHG